MTSCESMRPQLDALLDGELAPADARALESHLLDCAACRREFAATRETSQRLARHFAAERADAPPVPARLVAAAAGRTSRLAPILALPRRWVPLAAAAALLVTATVIALVAGPEARAQGDLARALANWRAARCVELDLRFSLPGVEQARRLLGLPSVRPVNGVLAHVWLQDPDLLVATARADLPSMRAGDMLGWDGREAWLWSPTAETVHVWPQPTAGFEQARAALVGSVPAAGVDVSHLLSFAFVRELAAGEQLFDLTELPEAAAGGRKRYRLAACADCAPDVARHWPAATLTIDPSRDQIEAIEFELKFDGSTIGWLRADVVSNGGARSPDFFSWLEHAPADSEVIDGPAPPR